MELTMAVHRVKCIANEIRMREECISLPMEMREEARADRVAIEVVCEWAMKAYEKDENVAVEMLNAYHC